MPSILEKCKLVLYADDALIYTIANSDEECRENIKHDMKKIDEWLKINKLKLNENKTQIMEIIYLGFIIDKKLNFNEQIDYLSWLEN